MSDVFVKHVRRGRAELELEMSRAQAASAALRGHPDMLTPALLGVNWQDSSLAFERLQGLQPFTASVDTRFFRLAGAALAILHERLELPPSLTRTRPGDEGVAGVVCIHGDYSPINLGICGDRLVIFDWGLRPWTRDTYTTASPAVDLAAFLAPFALPTWWDFRLPVKKLHAFLAAYAEALLDRPDIRRAAQQGWHGALAEQLTYLRRESHRRNNPAAVALHRLKVEINYRRIVRLGDCYANP